MTTLNEWKYKALQVIEGTDSYKQLNDLEKAAYITHLGLSQPVDKTVVGLKIDFFNDINGVIYTGSIQDIIKASMKEALAGIYDSSNNFADLEYNFWWAVAEGRLNLSGAPWVATFNGVDQRVDFPNRSVSVPSGTIIEMIAHIKTTNVGGAVMSAHTSDASQYLYLTVLGNGVLKVNTNGYTPGIGSTPVNDGQWHKIVMRLDTATGAYSTYVDDVFDYSGTHSNPAKLVGDFNVTAAARRNTTGGTPADYFSGIVADFGLVANGTGVFFASIDDGWDKNPEIHQDIIVGVDPHAEDGTMINGTEPMWTRDPTKPASPVFNSAYSSEYASEYTH